MLYFATKICLSAQINDKNDVEDAANSLVQSAPPAGKRDVQALGDGVRAEHDGQEQGVELVCPKATCT